MKVIFNSSFLEDLRRIDNSVKLYHYSLANLTDVKKMAFTVDSKQFTKRQFNSIFDEDRSILRMSIFFTNESEVIKNINIIYVYYSLFDQKEESIAFVVVEDDYSNIKLNQNRNFINITIPNVISEISTIFVDDFTSVSFLEGAGLEVGENLFRLDDTEDKCIVSKKSYYNHLYSKYASSQLRGQSNHWVDELGRTRSQIALFKIYKEDSFKLGVFDDTSLININDQILTKYNLQRDPYNSFLDSHEGCIKLTGTAEYTLYQLTEDKLIPLYEGIDEITGIDGVKINILEQVDGFNCKTDDLNHNVYYYKPIGVDISDDFINPYGIFQLELSYVNLDGSIETIKSNKLRLVQGKYLGAYEVIYKESNYNYLDGSSIYIFNSFSSDTKKFIIRLKSEVFSYLYDNDKIDENILYFSYDDEKYKDIIDKLFGFNYSVNKIQNEDEVFEITVTMFTRTSNVDPNNWVPFVDTDNDGEDDTSILSAVRFNINLDSIVFNERFYMVQKAYSNSLIMYDVDTKLEVPTVGTGLYFNNKNTITTTISTEIESLDEVEYYWKVLTVPEKISIKKNGKLENWKTTNDYLEGVIERSKIKQSFDIVCKQTASSIKDEFLGYLVFIKTTKTGLNKTFEDTWRSAIESDILSVPVYLKGQAPRLELIDIIDNSNVLKINPNKIEAVKLSIRHNCTFRADIELVNESVLGTKFPEDSIVFYENYYNNPSDLLAAQTLLVENEGGVDKISNIYLMIRKVGEQKLDDITLGRIRFYFNDTHLISDFNVHEATEDIQNYAHYVEFRKSLAKESAIETKYQETEFGVNEDCKVGIGFWEGDNYENSYSLDGHENGIDVFLPNLGEGFDAMTIRVASATSPNFTLDKFNNVSIDKEDIIFSDPTTGSYKYLYHEITISNHLKFNTVGEYNSYPVDDTAGRLGILQLNYWSKGSSITKSKFNLFDQRKPVEIYSIPSITTKDNRVLKATESNYIEYIEPDEVNAELYLPNDPSVIPSDNVSLRFISSHNKVNSKEVKNICETSKLYSESRSAVEPKNYEFAWDHIINLKKSNNKSVLNNVDKKYFEISGIYDNPVYLVSDTNLQDASSYISGYEYIDGEGGNKLEFGDPKDINYKEYEFDNSTYYVNNKEDKFHDYLYKVSLTDSDGKNTTYLQYRTKNNSDKNDTRTESVEVYLDNFKIGDDVYYLGKLNNIVSNTTDYENLYKLSNGVVTKVNKESGLNVSIGSSRVNSSQTYYEAKLMQGTSQLAIASGKYPDSYELTKKDGSKISVKKTTEQVQNFAIVGDNRYKYNGTTAIKKISIDGVDCYTTKFDQVSQGTVTNYDVTISKTESKTLYRIYSSDRRDGAIKINNFTKTGTLYTDVSRSFSLTLKPTVDLYLKTSSGWYYNNRSDNRKPEPFGYWTFRSFRDSNKSYYYYFSPNQVSSISEIEHLGNVVYWTGSSSFNLYSGLGETFNYTYDYLEPHYSYSYKLINSIGDEVIYYSPSTTLNTTGNLYSDIECTKAVSYEVSQVDVLNTVDCEDYIFLVEGDKLLNKGNSTYTYNWTDVSIIGSNTYRDGYAQFDFSKVSSVDDNTLYWIIGAGKTLYKRSSGTYILSDYTMDFIGEDPSNGPWSIQMYKNGSSTAVWSYGGGPTSEVKQTGLTKNYYSTAVNNETRGKFLKVLCNSCSNATYISGSITVPKVISSNKSENYWNYYSDGSTYKKDTLTYHTQGSLKFGDKFDISNCIAPESTVLYDDNFNAVETITDIKMIYLDGYINTENTEAINVTYPCYVYNLISGPVYTKNNYNFAELSNVDIRSIYSDTELSANVDLSNINISNVNPDELKTVFYYEKDKIYSDKKAKLGWIYNKGSNYYLMEETTDSYGAELVIFMPDETKVGNLINSIASLRFYNQYAKDFYFAYKTKLSTSDLIYNFYNPNNSGYSQAIPYKYVYDPDSKLMIGVESVTYRPLTDGFTVIDKVISNYTNKSGNHNAYENNGKFYAIIGAVSLGKSNIPVYYATLVNGSFVLGSRVEGKTANVGNSLRSSNKSSKEELFRYEYESSPERLFSESYNDYSKLEQSSATISKFAGQAKKTLTVYLRSNNPAFEFSEVTTNAGGLPVYSDLSNNDGFDLTTLSYTGNSNFIVNYQYNDKRLYIDAPSLYKNSDVISEDYKNYYYFKDKDKSQLFELPLTIKYFNSKEEVDTLTCNIKRLYLADGIYVKANNIEHLFVEDQGRLDINVLGELNEYTIDCYSTDLMNFFNKTSEMNLCSIEILSDNKDYVTPVVNSNGTITFKFISSNETKSDIETVFRIKLISSINSVYDSSNYIIPEFELTINHKRKDYNIYVSYTENYDESPINDSALPICLLSEGTLINRVGDINKNKGTWYIHTNTLNTLGRSNLKNSINISQINWFEVEYIGTGHCSYGDAYVTYKLTNTVFSHNFNTTELIRGKINIEINGVTWSHDYLQGYYTLYYTDGFSLNWGDKVAHFIQNLTEDELSEVGSLQELYEARCNKFTKLGSDEIPYKILSSNSTNSFINNPGRYPFGLLMLYRNEVELSGNLQDEVSEEIKLSDDIIKSSYNIITEDSTDNLIAYFSEGDPRVQKLLSNISYGNNQSYGYGDGSDQYLVTQYTNAAAKSCVFLHKFTFDLKYDSYWIDDTHSVSSIFENDIIKFNFGIYYYKPEKTLITFTSTTMSFKDNVLEVPFTLSIDDKILSDIGENILNILKVDTSDSWVTVNNINIENSQSPYNVKLTLGVDENKEKINNAVIGVTVDSNKFDFECANTQLTFTN